MKHFRRRSTIFTFSLTSYLHYFISIFDRKMMQIRNIQISNDIDKKIASVLRWNKKLLIWLSDIFWGKTSKRYVFQMSWETCIAGNNLWQCYLHSNNWTAIIQSFISRNNEMISTRFNKHKKIRNIMKICCSCHGK